MRPLVFSLGNPGAVWPACLTAAANCPTVPRNTDSRHHGGGQAATRRGCRTEAARSAQSGQRLSRCELPGPGWIHVEITCQGPGIGGLRCPLILGAVFHSRGTPWARAQPPTPSAPRETKSWPQRRGSGWSDFRTCSPSSLEHIALLFTLLCPLGSFQQHRGCWVPALCTTSPLWSGSANGHPRLSQHL